MTKAHQLELIPLPRSREATTRIKPLTARVWTQSKAHLIANYLFLFIQITKHGAYIDGFAGPQYPDESEAWAANLVVNLEPRWLKKFYLYDLSARQHRALLKLKKDCLPDESRTIHVERADFNEAVYQLFSSKVIGENEATFCLLDQRTFECQWSTVATLANCQKRRFKIELFYFLAEGWLDRAVAAQKDLSVVDRWWGCNDWPDFFRLSGQNRAESLARRFIDELDYQSAMAWPIFEGCGSERVMYYMIHATDHLEAPLLMRRAYERAVRIAKHDGQLRLPGVKWCQ